VKQETLKTTTDAMAPPSKSRPSKFKLNKMEEEECKRIAEEAKTTARIQGMTNDEELDQVYAAAYDEHALKFKTSKFERCQERKRALVREQREPTDEDHPEEEAGVTPAAAEDAEEEDEEMEDIEEQPKLSRAGDDMERPEETPAAPEAKAKAKAKVSPAPKKYSKSNRPRDVVTPSDPYYQLVQGALQNISRHRVFRNISSEPPLRITNDANTESGAQACKS
jgi:hypothetical protein